MSVYLHYFFESFGQIIPLVSTLVLWVGLSFIGRVVAGRDGFSVAAPFYGWAVVTFVFTVFGVFAAIPFTWMAWFIAILSLGAGVYVYRRDGFLIDSSLIKLFILTTPLWLMASAMAASQWDEFSHWLPSTQFLLEADGFPDKENAVTGGSFPAYPYGWPILMYLSGKIAGGFVENAGSLLNLFALLTFGLVLMELVQTGLGAEKSSGKRGWIYAALGALAVTAFNPTFVQKLVLTAYSETTTSITIGLAGILAWLMLNAVAEGERRKALGFAWQSALALAVHINVRQANLVLFLILVIATILVGLRDTRIPLRDLVRPLIIMIIPPLIIYASWRFHVANNLSGAEFSIRPFGTWFIDLVPQILLGMITVASKKGVYFGLMIIVLIFGVRGLIKMKTPLDRLALIASLMFLGYNAFLLFSYVAAFGKYDALRAASYWRYNIHAGFFGIAFAALGLSVLWTRFSPSEIWRRRLGFAALAILIIAPFGFAKKIRFDNEGLKPHYQAVAAELKATLAPGSSYLIIDPIGNGEVGVITKFRMGQQFQFKGVVSAFSGPSRDVIQTYIGRSKPTHVLIHSLVPGMDTLFGMPFKSQTSYLLEPTGDGWRSLKSWPIANP